ncbi:MAG TPA: sulfite exporter TauE/SafE family protein [Candidatus Saccharicenans sp.]|nr:sulfite exporter TauE/SafE family protein [Candidatus Saccharicenans sp.]
MNSLLIVVIGLLAGVFSGLFGIGGGIVMVPAMVVLANFPLIKATGTSLAAILLPVGILGVIAYYRARLIDIRGSILIAIGMVISVIAGAWLAHTLPAGLVQKLYAIFCLYVSWTFIQPVEKFKKYFGRPDKKNSSNVPAEVPVKNTAENSGVKPEESGFSAASYLDSRTGRTEDSKALASQPAGPTPGIRPHPAAVSSQAGGAATALASTPSQVPVSPHPHALALIGVGLVAGVMSGMFGIGGGNIIVPFLILFLHYPPKRAIATSLGALLAPVGLPGVIYYYRAGTLDLRVAGMLAIGLVLGTVMGARVNIRISGELVKVLYGIFLIFVAARFLFF